MACLRREPVVTEWSQIRHHTPASRADSAGSLARHLAQISGSEAGRGPASRRHPVVRPRLDEDALGLTSAGVTWGPWDGAYARDVIAALPDDSPVTAIVAGNDELAAGAIAGAVQRGWSVPARVSVSGWDDNPVGAFMPPALTTVRVDHASLGRAAMERLIASVRGTPLAVEDQPPLNTVIWRASVASAP